jgi:pimeloyl-ACP methyl ester carboxylesterase
VNHGPEPVFFERALKFDNDLEDETVLFFEPASVRSRAAAAASHERIALRTEGRSPVIPEATYLRLLASGRGDLFPDTSGYDAFLRDTDIPVLVISGDHEIVFPVHNWFDRVRLWKSLHLMVIPQAGHGAHHQEPQFCADSIRSFVQNVSK